MGLAGNPPPGQRCRSILEARSGLQGAPEWPLTSSCREGPSPVSTHARQRLPPWAPRKMGTLKRSRPLLGSTQIFSGRQERREPGGERTPVCKLSKLSVGRRSWDTCRRHDHLTRTGLRCSLPLGTVSRGWRKGRACGARCMAVSWGRGPRCSPALQLSASGSPTRSWPSLTYRAL